MSKINNSDIVNSFESICNTAKLPEHVEPSKPWPRPEAKIDDGGPAFPMKVVITDYGDPVEVKEYHPGMTLRDYFAIHSDIPWDAAIETLELNGCKEPTMKQVADARATMKYIEADAMIEARRG